MKQDTRNYGKHHPRFRKGFADGGAVDNDEIEQAVKDQIIPRIAGKAAGDAVGRAVAEAVPGLAPVRAAIGKTVGRLAAPKVAQAVRNRQAEEPMY